MSGPIRFMILAIVIGIKKSLICLFRKKVGSVQPIHTDPVDFYSRKVMCGIVRLTNVPEMIWPLSFFVARME
jgi:hypothetical protein